MVAVARYPQPLVLQTVFFAIWFGADLILVQRMLGSTAAGNYAAAKSLANAVYLAPSAVSGAVMSRIARMPEMSLGGYLGRVLVFATVVTTPLSRDLRCLRQAADKRDFRTPVQPGWHAACGTGYWHGLLWRVPGPGWKLERPWTIGHRHLGNWCRDTGDVANGPGPRSPGRTARRRHCLFIGRIRAAGGDRCIYHSTDRIGPNVSAR